MFSTVGIIAKPNDYTSEKAVSQLSSWLIELGVAIVEYDDIKENADLIIVAGGDGTIISVVRNFVDANIPVLGVNLGRLGFLADVNLTNMFDDIDAILSGNYVEEKRALLSCNVMENDAIISNNLAFNDVVMHRKQDEKIIEFETYINNKFVNSQRADGLIINTATGSTAYALSSGGPIIHPEVKTLSLVPICPHTLSNRPILINEFSEIRVELCETNTNAVVSFDAQTSLTISDNQQLIIFQHNNFAHLIHPVGYDYFNIIRTKLQWGVK